MSWTSTAIVWTVIGLCACGRPPVREARESGCLAYPTGVVPPFSESARLGVAEALVVSPDGSRIVYQDNRRRLVGWLRGGGAPVEYTSYAGGLAGITKHGGIYLGRPLQRVEVTSGRELLRRNEGLTCGGMWLGPSGNAVDVAADGRFVVVASHVHDPETDVDASSIIVVDDCVHAAALRGPPVCAPGQRAASCPSHEVQRLPPVDKAVPHYRIVEGQGLEIDAATMVGDTIASVEVTNDRFVVVRALSTGAELSRQPIHLLGQVVITHDGWVVGWKQDADDGGLVVRRVEGDTSTERSIDLPSVPTDDSVDLWTLFRGWVLARYWSTESDDTTWWIVDPAAAKIVWQTSGRDVRAVAVTPAGEIYAARSRGVCLETRKE